MSVEPQKSKADIQGDDLRGVLEALERAHRSGLDLARYARNMKRALADGDLSVLDTDTYPFLIDGAARGGHNASLTLKLALEALEEVRP